MAEGSGVLPAVPIFDGIPGSQLAHPAAAISEEAEWQRVYAAAQTPPGGNVGAQRDGCLVCKGDLPGRFLHPVWHSGGEWLESC